MNIMYRLLLFIFFVACANISYSQIADDFEFIDHKVRNSSHGVSKVIGDEVIYVSHNLWPGPMTSVIKVNTNDNSVDTLLTTFSSESKLQEFPDGTFQIFLFNLFDYDVGIPGFYAIEYDGAEIHVNTHTPYFDSNPDWNSYPYANGVVKGEGDVYYISSWNDVHKFIADSVSSVLFISPTNTEFHQNSDHDIFAYDLNTLYSFSEDSLIALQVFDKEILDVENNDEFNDILFNGLLERWTMDFSQKIVSWPIPDEIISFYQLEIDTLTLTGLVSDENQFSFTEFDVFGNGDVIYQNVYEDQAIVGFHHLTDSKMLLIGSDSIPEIEYHTNFFRNIDFDNEIEYESRDVSIDSYELYQFATESEFQYVNSQTGDSIFQTYHYTELNISLSNQSETSISLLDCKSGFIFQLWFPSPQEYTFENLQLSPGESITIRDTLKQITQLQDLIFAVPGADFRFNNHSNRVAYPDFTADFENFDLDFNLILFPNPASELLNIEIDETLESIAVYNSIGQLMIFKSSGSNLNEVDVSSLEAGCYYLRLKIYGEKAFATQQFIKIIE